MLLPSYAGQKTMRAKLVRMYRIPRRHHIQPQVLLRTFADANDRVMVASKLDERRHLTNIKNVSVIRDANTLMTDGGPDAALEVAFAKVEAQFPAIMKVLDNVTRSAAEDALVRGMVAVQWARDGYHRYWMAEEVQTIYDALLFALREAEPKLSEGEIEVEMQHYGRTNVVQSHVDPNPKNVAVAGTPFLIGKFYDDLMPYPMTILRSTEPRFLTADSPTSLYDRFALEERSDDTERAIFLEETELIVPLTGRHVALFATAFHTQSADVGPEIVAIVNARTVRSAARDVYGSPAFDIDLSTWWWRRSIQSTI